MRENKSSGKQVNFIIDRSLEGYLFCLLFGAIGLGIGRLFSEPLGGLAFALLLGFIVGAGIGFLIGNACFSYDSKEKRSFGEAYGDCLVLIVATLAIIAFIAGLVWLLVTLF